MTPRHLTPHSTQPAYGPDGPAYFGHIDAPNISFVAPAKVSRRKLRFGAKAGAGIQPVVETGVPMPKKLTTRRSDPPTQTHQIRVETGREEVTVHVGPDPAAVPPGGFAKLFNRVIDAGTWGRLTDAGRAVYLPLVRFADGRAGFRVRIGQAALIRHTGLSRSSVKRGLKDLLNSKLVVIAREGGVSAEGVNQSNVYQLLVPVDPKDFDDLGEAEPVEPRAPISMKNPKPAESAPRSSQAPPPVRKRPPSPSASEPTVGSSPAPEPVRTRPAGAVQRRAEPPATGGPLLRGFSSDHSNSESSSKEGGEAGPPTAAAVLEGLGIERPVAWRLAASHPAGRVAEAVATMQYRLSRGQCGNPAAFVIEALSKNWPVPAPVAEAKRRAERDAARAELIRREQASRAERDAALSAGIAAADAVLDALPDAEFDALAAEVLAGHADNPAVAAILRRKPPRESRLMRAEIAARLTASTQPLPQ